MTPPDPLRDALENDLRDLRGAGPMETAERLITRGWTRAALATPPLAHICANHDESLDEAYRKGRADAAEAVAAEYVLARLENQ